MANIKITFLGTEQSKTHDSELQVYVNTLNEIFIQIERDDEYPAFICLDKSTAIKFSKALRTQISLLESEVNNG